MIRTTTFLSSGWQGPRESTATLLQGQAPKSIKQDKRETSSNINFSDPQQSLQLTSLPNQLEQQAYRGLKPTFYPVVPPSITKRHRKTNLYHKVHQILYSSRLVSQIMFVHWSDPCREDKQWCLPFTQRGREVRNLTGKKFLLILPAYQVSEFPCSAASRRMEWLFVTPFTMP